MHTNLLSCSVQKKKGKRKEVSITHRIMRALRFSDFFSAKSKLAQKEWA